MESLVTSLVQHGYSILFLIVWLEAIGLPVPAAVALLAAGAAGAQHTLDPGAVFMTAIAAMLCGDLLMFVLGRRTGWWLLGLLCRFTLNPEACILRSADLFYKRGRVMLIFAKFIPGINTMSPPLAGSMGMPFLQFAGLDIAGSILYAGAFFGAGFLFSDFLAALLRGYSAVGNVLAWVVGVAFVVWVAYRIRLWVRSRNAAPVPMVQPSDVAQRMSQVAIFDVRSHGYYDAGTQRVQGSRRMEPNALTEELGKLPHEKEIVLYCTCYHEATAVRVSRMLAERGIPSAVIEGGLSAWKKAGLPLELVPESDVVLLPKFA